MRGMPVIEVRSLIRHDPAIRVQISRWVSHKKIIKLKGGIYLLKEQYRGVEVNEFYLAALLKKPSYVSLEKALEYHNLIPEGVSVFTSVTPKRQANFVSDAGVFNYRHIKPSLFWGYRSVKLRGQVGFIAYPEKALLDLLYFKNRSASLEFIEGMRLQNSEAINTKRLLEYAQRFGRKDILFSARLLAAYIKERRRQEKRL